MIRTPPLVAIEHPTPTHVSFAFRYLLFTMNTPCVLINKTHVYLFTIDWQPTETFLLQISVDMMRELQYTQIRSSSSKGTIYIYLSCECMNGFQLNCVTNNWSPEGVLRNIVKLIVSLGCHIQHNNLRRFYDVQESRIFVRANIKSYLHTIWNGRG